MHLDIKNIGLGQLAFEVKRQKGAVRQERNIQMIREKRIDKGKNRSGTRFVIIKNNAGVGGKGYCHNNQQNDP